MKQSDSKAAWANYTQEELEFHFNPRVATPGVDAYNAARADINEQGLAWPVKYSTI